MKTTTTKTAKADIFSHDKENMFDVLMNFPTQVREALALGEQAPFFASSAIKNIVVLGMGGSAIGGDIVRSYVAATAPQAVPIYVSRGYTLPPGIDENTGVVVSSYSGDTEETLSAFDAARKKTKNFLVITTGGKLGTKATKLQLPTITPPAGLQPRCALGYSFFPLLTTLLRHNVAGKKGYATMNKAMHELLPLLEEKAAVYSKPTPKNPAFALAKKLQGTVPVLYSSSDILDTVNVRWRGQLHENAKNLAFGNLVPEMNHNEINSWSYPAAVRAQTSVLLLRDIAEHARVAVRFEAMKTLIGKKAKHLVELRGEGEHLLTRMFSLIYMGDWASYYLALLNGVDPTAIPLITELKKRLSAV